MGSKKEYQLVQVGLIKRLQICNSKIDRLIIKQVDCNNYIYLVSNETLLLAKISQNLQHVQVCKQNQFNNQQVYDDQSDYHFQLSILNNGWIHQYDLEQQERYIQQLIDQKLYEFLIDTFRFKYDIVFSKYINPNLFKDYTVLISELFLDQQMEQICQDQSTKLLFFLAENGEIDYIFKNLYDHYLMNNRLDQFFRSLEICIEEQKIDYVNIRGLKKIIEEQKSVERNMEIIEQLVLSLDVEKYQIEEILQLDNCQILINPITLIYNKKLEDFNTPLLKMSMFEKKDEIYGKYILNYLQMTLNYQYIDGEMMGAIVCQKFIEYLLQWMQKQDYVGLFCKINLKCFLGIVYQIIETYNLQYQKTII